MKVFFVFYSRNSTFNNLFRLSFDYYVSKINSLHRGG